MAEFFKIKDRIHLPSDSIPTLSRTPGWVSHLFLWLGKSSIWGRIPLPGRGTGTAIRWKQRVENKNFDTLQTECNFPVTTVTHQKEQEKYDTTRHCFGNLLSLWELTNLNSLVADLHADQLLVCSQIKQSLAWNKLKKSFSLWLQNTTVLRCYAWPLSLLSPYRSIHSTVWCRTLFCHFVEAWMENSRKNWSSESFCFGIT